MAAGELDIVMEEAAATLGYHISKEEQKKAVQAFVEGKDVFVSLLPLIFDQRREAVERRSIVMIVSAAVHSCNFAFVPGMP